MCTIRFAINRSTNDIINCVFQCIQPNGPSKFRTKFNVLNALGKLLIAFWPARKYLMQMGGHRFDICWAI